MNLYGYTKCARDFKSQDRGYIGSFVPRQYSNGGSVGMLAIMGYVHMRFRASQEDRSMKHPEVALCVDWSDLLVGPLAFKKGIRTSHFFLQIQFIPHRRGGGFATPNLGWFLP